MNTSEWISRKVNGLLPASGLMRKITNAPDAKPVKAPEQDNTTVAVRQLQTRLDGNWPRAGEALSPRLLRRVLGELEAVADPQISEVEGGRRALAVALWYGAAPAAERHDCWLLMSERFAPDPQQVQEASARYHATQHAADDGQAEIALRRALHSPRTRLLQRFAVFPDGLRFLVNLRAELLPVLKTDRRLLPLDAELEQLFSTWFDVAFLELKRISWDSPASLIEKLIHYEAVHDIRGWGDVKNRLDSDRRCYGFFHPQLPNEPLIFVEVALLDALPGSITPLLDESAASVNLSKANTAIFYSISNTQPGLRGVSFGDSLIKRVVETLKTEFPRLRTFATLSPIPGFRAWFSKNVTAMLERLDDKARTALGQALGGQASAAGVMAAAERATGLDPRSPVAHLLMQCAAHYLSQELSQGKPLDAVARFHLGNGARVEQLNWCGDPSAKGLRQSYGMMVNYLYDLKRLNKYRTEFANSKIAVSSAIDKLDF